MRVADQLTRPSSVPLIAETHTDAVGLVTSTRPIDPRRPSTTSRIVSGAPNTLSHSNSYSSESHTTSRFRDKVSDLAMQNQTSRRQSSRGLSRLEKDRDFIIDLAKFLRTRSPPPDNFMSLPEASEPLAPSRTLPFKMFHRQKSKRSSSTTFRTFQLPDSAVATKTIEGHWHLAISIPMEHDYLIGHPTPQQDNTDQSKAKQENSTREGPITVFKPLIRDVRPAALGTAKTTPHGHDDRVQSPAGPRLTSVAQSSAKDDKLEGIPNGKVGEGESSRPHGHQKTTDEERQAGESCFTSHNQSQGPCKTIFAYNVSRQQSQRSDAQRSSETAFSVRSLESSVGHARRKSSVSTAPSLNHVISSRGPESLKKQRSISGTSVAGKSPSAGLPPANMQGEISHRQDGFGPTFLPSSPNLASLAKESDSPDVAHVEDISIHKSPLKAVHATKRMLPDLPEGHSDGGVTKQALDAPIAVITRSKSQRRLRTRQSMPFDRKPAQDDEMESDSNIPLTPRSRREQVRALRSRDMAALRAANKFQQVMATVPMKLSRITPAIADEARPGAVEALSHTRNRTVSSSSIAKKVAHSNMVNTVSPIMLVADIEPRNGLCDQSDPFVSRLPSGRTKRTLSSPTGISGKLHSPKRSISPYSVSSDDSDFYHAIRRGRRTQSANSKGQNKAGQRRTYPRHHSPMQDGSIEARMRRIERTNAMMLQTLGAVVEMGVSFRELAELTASPEAQLRKAIGNHVERGLSTIEPLMLELNYAATNGEEEMV